MEMWWHEAGFLRLLGVWDFMSTITRVSLVEDDEPLRELWCRSIRRAKDFTLYHAFANAEDALTVLSPDPPDILIADWKLAGAITGIELVARLKQLHPQLLAVVVSGFKLADQPPDALLAGAQFPAQTHLRPRTG